MRFLVATLLCFVMVLSGSHAATAKARLIIIYAAQSEAALIHDEANLAKSVTARIAAIPGYDAQLGVPTASPAEAAHKLGADGYLILQAIRYEDGTDILLIDTFRTDRDAPVAENRIRVENWTLGSDFDASAVLAGNDASVTTGRPASAAPSLAYSAPQPQGTPNLVVPRQPDQGNTPITVTKFWTTKDAHQQYYYPYCGLCFHIYYTPGVHWNFVNQGGHIAKAIRFVIQETSPFGEGGASQFLDLTGTFSPNVSIESRVNIVTALQGNGTHWSIYAVKVLWDDGSIWEAPK